MKRFYIFIKNDFREAHISLLYLLSYSITTLVTLSVYWFTSKAFAGAVSDQLGTFNMRYFDFIVIGELTFLFPAHVYSNTLNTLKRWVNNNTFDSLIVSQRSIVAELALQLSASLPSQLLFIAIYVAIANIFFQWSISLLELLAIAAIILSSLALFFFLGLLMSALFILTGRGSSLVGQLVTLIAIVSGAYFPIHVLPQWVESLSRKGSPFFNLIESTRAISAGKWSEVDWFSLALSLGGWTVVFCVLALVFFNLSLYFVRKRGCYFPETRSLL